MKFNLCNTDAAKQTTECLVLPIFENDEWSPQAEIIDQVTQSMLKTLVTQGDIEGKIGQCLLLHSASNISAKRLLLVGCGKKNNCNESDFHKIINALTSFIKATQLKDISLYLTELTITNRDIAWLTKQTVLQFAASFYQYDLTKSTKNPPVKLEQVNLYAPTLHDNPPCEKAIHEAMAIAKGMNLAKDLAHLPGNICTPTYLASTATKLGKEFSSIKTKILDEKALQKLGANSFLAVSKGSAEPGKFIIMEYQGTDKSVAPIALIGKGITFDSGGISLKPPAAMDEMKFDMCGAANILGTMKILAELNLPINVVAIIAAAENMPSSTACKPGDIVTSLSGKTIEILNTDAEGRLVLADAITYSKQFNPKCIIDMATLTGGVVVALGKYPSGLFSNNDALAADIETAANQAYDRVWRLPIWPEYQTHLDSPFADVANVTGDRSASSIFAACFLQRFVEDTPWVHLDIAATAWNSGKNKSATARPIPLLVQFLLNQAMQQ